MSLLRGKLLIGLAAMAVGTAYAEPFRDGDTVVFFGSSTTASGRYHEYVTDFYRTRCPEADIRFVNSGVGGDNAGNAQKRVDADVTYYKPTWVLYNFGMNDVGRDAYTANRTPAQIRHGEKCRKDFEKNLVALADKVRAAVPEAKEMFATPQIYDDTADNSIAVEKNWVGCNAALAELGTFTEKTAADRKALFVNWHKPLNDLVNRRRAAGERSFAVNGKDRVHLLPIGHAVLAWEFLKAQGVPATVSDVTVDAKSGKVAKSENATVTDLKATADGVSCTVHAKALPFPVEPEAKGLLAEFDVEETLNREIFAVTGLKPGNYALLIDGAEVATGDAAAFAKGIRLGFNERTPQYAQAQKFFAENKRLADRERKIRAYAWKPQNREAAVREPLLEAQQKLRALVKTVPHRYEVRATK